MSPIHGATLNDKRNLSPKDYAALHEKGPIIDRAWVRDGNFKQPKINNGVVGVGQISKKKNRDNVIETDASGGDRNSDSKARDKGDSSSSVIYSIFFCN